MKIEALTQIDPALFADMKVYLQSGKWEIAFDSPTALWLRHINGRLHAMAVFDPAEARKLLALISPEDAVCARGCNDLREPAFEHGFNRYNPCRQVVYEKTAPLPVVTELTIRHPDEKDFPKIAESYKMSNEEQLREDFESPDFLGGYLNGEFVGYIDVHKEGAMGILHVFPPYRRRGYAEALYRTLINNQLKKNRLPFAQVLKENTASLELQRKTGLRISDDLIYWIWRDDEKNDGDH